ncbi:MAG: glutathione S-transferase N-terminal domain-containing protein [Burkholderiales bacterium]|nr:glutathione S-transferase N-terminal domain-containing protein [Burkholderiales bacterium]
MIELYYWPTPNGRKVSIMLEECELPYKLIPVNIQTGDQKQADFVQINPNGRIPAVIDTEPADRGKPVTIFESGAILQYLADKAGQLWPSEIRERQRVNAWLMWQMGGLGPMAGQASHFLNGAKEDVPYAKERFVKETSRLYGVLDRALRDSEYVAGDYSIADIAIYPWAVPAARQGQDLAGYPAVQRWLDRVGARAAVKRGMDVGAELRK